MTEFFLYFLALIAGLMALYLAYNYLQTRRRLRIRKGQKALARLRAEYEVDHETE